MHEFVTLSPTLTWKTVLHTLLAHTFHERVTEAVVGLAGVTTATAHGREHNEPVERRTVPPGGLVQVHGADDLRLANFLEHLRRLILHEAVL